MAHLSHEIVRIGKDGETRLSLPSGQHTDSFFAAFHGFFNSLVVPKSEPTHMDAMLCLVANEPFICGGCWLIKDYFKLWKMSDPFFCDPTMRAYQPFGDVLVATLNLCSGVMDYFPEISPASPLAFAGEILQEQKEWSITYSHYFQGQHGKSDFLACATVEIEALKEWQNPHDSVQVPLTHNLIEAAIEIARPRKRESKDKGKQRREFYNRAWKPYLKALSKWNSASKNGVTHNREKFVFGIPQIKGDALVMPTKGRGNFTKIYEIPPKKMSGRGRKRA